MLAVLARDPKIEVHHVAPGTDLCAAVEAGQADAILQLDVTPASKATYGLIDSTFRQTCSDGIKNGHCGPGGTPTWTSSITVALTTWTPRFLKGRPQHFCEANRTLGAWHSATVEGIDGWKPLVSEQIARVTTWIDANLNAKAFAVDTEVRAGALAVGALDGVHVGDAFLLGTASDALATKVTPSATRLERLWDSSPLVDEPRVVDQGRPWVLTLQPHGGVTRVDDSGVTSTMWIRPRTSTSEGRSCGSRSASRRSNSRWDSTPSRARQPPGGQTGTVTAIHCFEAAGFLSSRRRVSGPLVPCAHRGTRARLAWWSMSAPSGRDESAFLDGISDGHWYLRCGSHLA